MSYPKQHRERMRLRIVRSAQALFNRYGFEGVSIDAIMAHAGLTRGGFYAYFKTKSDLYAEAVTLALTEPPALRFRAVRESKDASDRAQQVVRCYLSATQFKDIEHACPMVALPGDVSRSDAKVKRAFQSVFQAMAGVFEQGLAQEGRSDRDRALAIAAMCVGGMVVARALEDPSDAARLRAVVTDFALGLGEWAGSRRGRAAARMEMRGLRARRA